MHIFIGWATEGSLSHQVAQRLRELLPDIFVGQVECYLSSADTEAGATWLEDLFEQISQTNLGLLCVTQQSAAAPWLLFEAGALAVVARNGKNTGRVCPLLIEMGPGTLRYPLAALQYKSLNSEDEAASREVMLGIVGQINTALAAAGLGPERLERQFDAYWSSFWSDYKRYVSASDATSATAAVPITNNQLLEEIRSGFRQMSAALGGRRAEVSVTCPECKTAVVAEFADTPGATRHMKCEECGLPFIAHVIGDGQVLAKPNRRVANSATTLQIVENSHVVLAVKCPACGAASEESFSTQPGATRHLSCGVCRTSYIAHRQMDGTAISKAWPTGQTSVESAFLHRTRFWVPPTDLSAMIDAALQAHESLDGSKRTPNTLKRCIRQQHPEFPSNRVFAFINVLFHGGAFGNGKLTRPDFESVYAVPFSREGILRSFYLATVRRLRVQFPNLGPSSEESLRTALQCDLTPGAAEALREALTADPAPLDRLAGTSGHCDHPSEDGLDPRSAN